MATENNGDFIVLNIGMRINKWHGVSQVVATPTSPAQATVATSS